MKCKNKPSELCSLLSVKDLDGNRGRLPPLFLGQTNTQTARQSAQLPSRKYQLGYYFSANIFHRRDHPWHQWRNLFVAAAGCIGQMNCIKGISKQAEMDRHALLIFCLGRKAGGAVAENTKQHHRTRLLSRRRVCSNHRLLHFTFPLKSNSSNRCQKGEESNKWSGPLSLFSSLSVAWWPTELSGSIEAPWKWQQRPGLAFWHRRAISVAQFLRRKPTVTATGH